MKNRFSAMAAIALLGICGVAQADFVQGFESNSDGWLTDSNTYGTVNRVATGAGGITSASGNHHAIFGPAGGTGPFTRFGGYSSVWSGGFSASIDIYLDTSWTDGSGFDYSVAASNNTGGHLRDFIFHVDKDTDTHELLLNANNNSSFAARNLSGLPDSGTVSDSGWYTFVSDFKDVGGALSVNLSVKSSIGATVFDKTLNSGDAISGVGGNRYGWFTFIDVQNVSQGSGGIAVDNTQLTVVPLPAAAWAGLGLMGVLGMAKIVRRRPAQA